MTCFERGYTIVKLQGLQPCLEACTRCAACAAHPLAIGTLTMLPLQTQQQRWVMRCACSAMHLRFSGTAFILLNKATATQQLSRFACSSIMVQGFWLTLSKCLM
jgi:hypothetical protein